MFALAPGQGIVAHREAGDQIHAYIELNRPAEWIHGIDFAAVPAAIAQVAAQFDGWAPELMALINEHDAPPVPRAIHALPSGHRWDRTPGVTLLGDAAHLMAPFAGERANLAMFDGAELGKEIAKQPDDIEAALATYEEDLFARSAWLRQIPIATTNSFSTTVRRSDWSTSLPVPGQNAGDESCAIPQGTNQQITNHKSDFSRWAVGHHFQHRKRCDQNCSLLGSALP